MSGLRIAFRSLSKTPVVFLVAVVSLALGIGANTAIFSFLDQILLKMLPVRDPEQLVYFYHPGPVQGRSTSDENGSPSFSYPMFRDLQGQAGSVFSGIAGARQFGASLVYQGSTLPGRVHLVSGNYFPLLGVRPAVGRFLDEGDDQRPGEHWVAVLGYRYWNNQLGANPGVLNQSLLVNGYSMTIVGVAHKDFTSETFGSAPDVFVPISMKAQMTPNWDGMKDRKDYWVNLIGRRKPDVTIEQAEAAINGPYQAMLADDLKLITGWSKTLQDRYLAKRILLKPGEHGRGGSREDARTPVIVLISMTVMVLLIACANIANLLIARAATRTKEIAVRLALGAGRARVARLLLVEASAIALAGGLLALLVARWTIDGVASAIDESDMLLEAGLNGRVLAYCAGVTALTAFLFGLAPSWQVSRVQVAAMLKDQAGQASASAGSSRLRSALVAAQAGLSLLLLIVSGLFAKSLVNVTRIDAGMDTSRMVTFSLNPALNRYDRARTAELYAQLEERLARVPGVSSVTLSSLAFLTGDNWGSSIRVPGYRPAREDEPSPSYAEGGPRYLATLGIPLRAGREFTAADTLGAPRVAIVNETFARRYYNTSDVIGRKFGQDEKYDIEIVGLAKDTHYSGLKDPEQRAVFYLPYRQNRSLGGYHVYVRTNQEGDEIMGQIRRVVGEIDPALPVRNLKTMQAQVNESLYGDRIVAALAGVFAALATLLAAVGLYGVLAYSVTQRTREIGIRMAFGARPSDLRRMITREVARMFGLGAIVGLPLALALGRYAESELYGVKPHDPVVIASAVVVLSVIALAAALAPARRATSVDPMRALRYE